MALETTPAPAPEPALAAPLPLCVDLDGTLIRGDLLFESVTLLIKRNPLYLLLLPLWLLQGRAALKSQVARRVALNAAALPYNAPLLEWLAAERAGGRRLWLCTASNEKLATGVATHLKVFEGVLASSERTNLAGTAKAATLVERFGERGFDYCGNERRDLSVWEHAHGAIVVGGPRLESQAARHTAVVRTFPARQRRLRALLRELRPHQWTKNVLLLVPLLAAHHASDLASDLAVLLGVLSFCLCASSVYVLNDLLDLESDRAHPRKCRRPLASGELPISAGLTMAPLLLAASVVTASFLPPRFWMVLGTYYALTLGYSFLLKGLVLTDALALAGLYMLRVIAGAAAAAVPLSFWLLLFSVLLFLSLAFVKRYAELEALRRQHRRRAAGRGYSVEDLPILQSMGSAAGYLSVVVLALYVNSPDIQAMYRQPKLIWSLCVLMLYWVSRIWMTAQRGQMHDDPVVFALRDPQSLAIGALAAVIVALAI